MSRRLRLLVLSAFAGRGGTGRWLSTALPQLAHQMDVDCLLKPQPWDAVTPLRQALAGGRVENLPLQSPLRLFAARRIWKAIRQSNPDVIVVHDPFSMVGLSLLRLLGLVRRVPILLVVHSVVEDFPHVGALKRALIYRLTSLALRRRDVIVAVSSQIATYLRRSVLGNHRIEEILNGFVASTGTKVDGRAPPSGRPLQVGVVGRLSIEKGSDRIGPLIRAAGDSPIHWHVAGAGQLEPQVLLDLKPYIDQGQVTFHGWIEDPVALMHQLDVLVLVSRTEGCPFSVLEAFAAGTLVVSLEVGGLPEVLDYGSAGLLVQDIGQMALVLGEIAKNGISSYSQQVQYGANLLEGRYSFQRMVDLYTLLIRELSSTQ